MTCGNMLISVVDIAHSINKTWSHKTICAKTDALQIDVLV